MMKHSTAIATYIKAIHDIYMPNYNLDTFGFETLTDDNIFTLTVAEPKHLEIKFYGDIVLFYLLRELYSFLLETNQVTQLVEDVGQYLDLMAIKDLSLFKDWIS